MVQRLGAVAGEDSQRGCEQVAADHPADHQVEAGQATGAACLQRHDIVNDDRAALLLGDLTEDLLGGAHDARAATAGDHQRVLLPTGVQHVGGVDAVVLDHRLGGVAGLDHLRGDGVSVDLLELGRDLAGLLCGGHHGHGDVAGLRRVERPDVRPDEGELDQEDPGHEGESVGCERLAQVGSNAHLSSLLISRPMKGALVRRPVVVAR